MGQIILDAQKKDYRLYDAYEGKELLGEGTFQEIKELCRQRDLDTDGEWYPILYKLRDGKYRRFEDWNY